MFCMYAVWVECDDYLLKFNNNIYKDQMGQIPCNSFEGGNVASR